MTRARADTRVSPPDAASASVRANLGRPPPESAESTSPDTRRVFRDTYPPAAARARRGGEQQRSTERVFVTQRGDETPEDMKMQDLWHNGEDLEVKTEAEAGGLSGAPSRSACSARMSACESTTPLDGDRSAAAARTAGSSA